MSHAPTSSPSKPPATRSALRAAFKFDALDRRSVTRLLCMLAIIIFTAISLFAFRASEQKQAERSAANSAAAWQQVGRVSTAANSIDAFATTWSAQHADGANSANGAGQRTLSWRVRDARDLRSSLLALDATKAPVQRIDIVRRDASFTVVAEVAP